MPRVAGNGRIVNLLSFAPGGCHGVYTEFCILRRRKKGENVGVVGCFVPDTRAAAALSLSCRCHHHICSEKLSKSTARTCYTVYSLFTLNGFFFLFSSLPKNRCVGDTVSAPDYSRSAVVR